MKEYQCPRCLKKFKTKKDPVCCEGVVNFVSISYMDPEEMKRIYGEPKAPLPQRPPNPKNPPQPKNPGRVGWK